MQIPAEMRRRPPEPTLQWVAAAVGPRARVTRVRRLRNAWAAAMHAVDVTNGADVHRLVVRRWARRDLPPDVGVVENESAALTVVAASTVPAPRLVAADATATHADVPALVMTRVPGRDTLAPADLDRFLAGLASTLRMIHETPVAAGTLNYFRPWGLDTVTKAPAWSHRPEVWERAIEIANQPVPPHERVLVHRDFHPGNVLWQRARVTGVVDWTHTCRGPAAADLAHCRVNLALLFGLAAADDFSRRYGPVADLAWHDIADVVGTGGDSTRDVWRWHDAGRTDITVQQQIDVSEEFLARALRRL
jgi:aminoglycoside phosphotransferase (APT) family kinase protein